MRTSLAVCTFLFILIISANSLRSQQIPTGELAKIGPRSLSAEEYFQRFELSVYPFKDRSGNLPWVKHEFLYSLIAEKLLALEAANHGLTADPMFKKMTRLTEDILLRDKLYKIEVASKVKITEKEILDTYNAENIVTRFDFLFSPTEAGIGNLVHLLKSGIPFDTLLALQKADTSLHGSERVVNAGSADDTVKLPPELEQRMASMNPGEISEPVKGDDGYYIIRKTEHRTNPLPPTPTEWASIRSRIEKQLRMQKENERAMEFLREVWGTTKAEADPELFRKLYEAVKTVLETQRNAGAGNRFGLTFTNIAQVEEKLREHLQKTLITMPGESISLSSALEKIAFAGFIVDSVGYSHLAVALNEKIRELIQNELLTRYARELRLQDDPSVQRDLQMWQDAWLAALMKDRIWQQFISNPDSIWSYYERHKDDFGPPPQVKIIEVVTGDLQTMEHVIKELSSGISMRELAAKYSIAPNAKTDSGVVGPVQATALGSIGREVLDMEINETRGPFQTPEGYTIFTLLDKKFPSDTAVRSFHDVVENVREQAKPAVYNHLVDDLVERLTRKYGVEINQGLLNSIKVTPIQMFTIRTMGFGGRMTAVPGTPRLYEGVMRGLTPATTPKP